MEIKGLSQHHGLGGFMYNFNVFVVAWAIALGAWRFGRIEEKWTARLEQGTAEVH